ncbi:hypothetical protein C6Q12_24935 [Burkholderia multivorans]|nr:hypothetical protein C6Q12_24935 [Burkholderia multivorans]
MSQLVRVAPGVIFSSDVLAVEWVRKFRPSAGDDSPPENEQRSERRGRPNSDMAQVVQGSDTIQMSLL